MDGIIVINKEKGWTSNDVVQKVKHIFNEKVGHTGTLDPLAIGVLPLLIGKGTLLSKYLVNHDKEYIATIRLGIKTITGDSEGDVIEKKEVLEAMLEEENVLQVLDSFKGKIKQIPPMYSAIKINGKKLYEYAREGRQVEVKPREIEIYDIELISISKNQKEITYKVSCSKGTYIRTLCEDIAYKLGTVGFMEELQRIKVGDFKIEQAVKISEIENDEEFLSEHLITIEDFFENKGKIILQDDKLKMYLNGTKICLDKKDGVYRVYDKFSKFIGIGIIQNNKLKRDVCI